MGDTNRQQSCNEPVLTNGQGPVLIHVPLAICMAQTEVAGGTIRATFEVTFDLGPDLADCRVNFRLDAET